MLWRRGRLAMVVGGIGGLGRIGILGVGGCEVLEERAVGNGC